MTRDTTNEQTAESSERTETSNPVASPETNPDRPLRSNRTRRRVLHTGALLGIGALAGCSTITGDGGGDGNDDGNGGDGTDGGTTSGGDGGTIPGELSLGEFRGSGALVEGRADLAGDRIADLPDLEGSLTVYLGGGEGGLYEQLLGFLGDIYPDFQPSTRLAPTAQLANTIIEEERGGGSPADVFWAVDAGSLSIISDRGHAKSLPSDVTDPVPEAFHPDDTWVGTAGRARAVPFNSESLSKEDIPSDVMAFPEVDAFDGNFGWAPTYGAFQAFITAMRILEGESATRQWLTEMQSMIPGAKKFPDEFLVSNAAADGTINAGFANHYYGLRVRNSRPDAPLGIAFTSNDAGALVNTAGAQLLSSSEKDDLAITFIRHLLSVEAQEFFATRTFAYPMIPGVPPAGGLPPIDELNPPELDLTKLSDLGPTLQLLKDTNVL